MFQSFFQSAQPASVNAAISVSTAPKEIVRACMHQISAQTQKKDKELRDLLQEEIDSLPADDEDHYIDDVCVDQKFFPLKTACERPNQPKLVQTTLAVIEKLVSSDLLVGSEFWTEPLSAPSTPPPMPDPGTPDSSRPLVPQKLVMDVMVETVFKAVQKASPEDEEIHLLAIRCVLSCFLSRHRLVHGQSLMACVRTCYLINKNSRSTTAQSTATAALTQILSTLTSRLDETVLDKMNGGEKPDHSIQIISDWSGSYARNILNKTVILSDPDNDANDDRGRIGWCVVCGEPADYYCRKAREPVCSMTCKQTNLNRLAIVSGEISKPTRSKKIFKTMEYKDVLAVFRSLCRLSSSTSGTDYNSSSAAIVKSTRLSLELISSILESSKRTLYSDPGFIDAVRTSLFDCLLTNSVSPVPGIFDVALELFQTLLNGFKEQMLTEIGLFVHQVLVYIAESPNSPEAHKLKALEIYKSFSAELVLKLFQQFDCSIDQKNVIELSVTALVGLVKSGSPAAAAGSVEALSKLVNSLADFVFKTRSSNGAEKPDSMEAQTIVSPSGLASAGEFNQKHPVGEHTQIIPSHGKQRKMLLQEGLELFKQKPTKGVDFLVIHGFIESPDSPWIARAFLEMPSLDKRAIGDYIGENKAQNLEVLYALVDLMDFKNLELDQALRNFLRHFRLPGEAQKIDRIMEKFADKFASDNPSRYANADAAYVLSFAVIMLNTDLHSAQIKKKMTIEEFVRLGKGINTEIEIQQAELERLYRNIEAEEISMNEDEALRKQQQFNSVIAPQDDQLTVQRKRLEMFLKETEQMIQKTKVTLTEQRREKGVMKESSEIAISRNDVKDILIITNVGLLEALKSAVNSSWSSEEIQTHAIDTIAVITRLAILYEMESVRTDFFSTLVDLALIDVSKQPVEHRTSEAMRTVLELAGTDGDGIGGSAAWLSVVKLISQIDRMSLIASMKFGNGNLETAPAPQVGGISRLLFRSPQASASGPIINELEKLNAEIVTSTTDLSLIDHIFSNSVGLSPVSILALTSALVETSTQELNENPQRLFCAQRLVELADLNMSRQIRIVWSKLWNIIAPFFVKIATQGSMFAIDSLRQLAFKFLSKPELGNYHFQTEFMRPFSLIMASADTGCQDLVLSVMDSLVKQVAPNLKSGWITVFSVIAIACKPGSPENLITSAIALLSEINTNAFQAALNKGEHFREYMHCLVLLVQRGDDFSFAAVESHIDRLVSRSVEEGELTSHWLSLSRGLASLLGDKRPQIRLKIEEILFTNFLNKKVEKIDSDTLQIVLRAVLIPWLDDFVHGLGEAVPMDTGVQIVTEISIAFHEAISCNFESTYSKFVFEIINFNALLVLCDRSDKVAHIGLDSLKKLFGLSRNSEQVIEGMVKLVSGTIPRILLENTNVTTLSSLPFNPDRVLCTCATHLHLIQLIGDLVGDLELSPSLFHSLQHVLSTLNYSKEFAVKFNAEIALRERLKSLGFMRDLRQLPGLLKQERASVSVSLKILFLIEHQVDKLEGVDKQELKNSRERLRKTCNEIVETYAAKETKIGTIAVQIRDSLIDEIEREINGLVPIIASVIVGSGFAGMSEKEFNENREWIFDLLLKLVLMNNRSIRKAAAAVLSKKFRPLISLS